MEVYNDAAVQKAVKKIDKVVKGAFRKHRFEDLDVEKHKASYKGSERKYIYGSDGSKNFCDKCAKSLTDEIDRGAVRIWVQAAHEYNKRLEKDGANYRVEVYRRAGWESHWTTRFYMDDVKVTVIISLDIRFKESE